MKFQHIAAAALAALTLGAALPAAANDYDRGSERRGRGEITVRTHRGEISVDRDDRLFYRLTERPYRFRPGHTYVYTDRCNRGGCLVLEFRGRGRPVDRFFAPLMPTRIAYRDHGGRWDRDNRDWRGDDRDWRDGQGARRSEDRDWRDDDNRARRDDADRRLEGGRR